MNIEELDYYKLSSNFTMINSNSSLYNMFAVIVETGVHILVCIFKRFSEPSLERMGLILQVISFRKLCQICRWMMVVFLSVER